MFMDAIDHHVLFFEEMNYDSEMRNTHHIEGHFRWLARRTFSTSTPVPIRRRQVPGLGNKSRYRFMNRNSEHFPITHLDLEAYGKFSGNGYMFPPTVAWHALLNEKTNRKTIRAFASTRLEPTLAAMFGLSTLGNLKKISVLH